MLSGGLVFAKLCSKTSTEPESCPRKVGVAYDSQLRYKMCKISEIANKVIGFTSNHGRKCWGNLAKITLSNKQQNFVFE